MSIWCKMTLSDVVKEEAALRVLVIKDDLCLCINCNAESMPAWMPANSLEDYTPDALQTDAAQISVPIPGVWGKYINIVILASKDFIKLTDSK